MSARPLVVRCGALGDVVMLTPIIRLLTARYGSPVEVVGSGDWTPPLLHDLPEVARVQLIRSRSTPYLLCPSQWALVRWLKARGRGPVYLCDDNPDMVGLIRRAGIPEADIVHRPAGDETLEDGVTPRLWPDRWIRMGLLDPAAGYPARQDIDGEAYRLPTLAVADAARRDFDQWRQARRLDGPLVLFQPGNKRTHKRGGVATRSHPKYWPPACWAEVAQAVWQALPGAQVLLCGSPNEHGVLEDIRAAVGNDPRLHNLARELPVPRLLALLQQAHSMVSVDTGPAHAAAALACPLVVLFGAASPAKWRPLGPGDIAVLGGTKGEHSRVADIGPDEVVAAWRALRPRCG